MSEERRRTDPTVLAVFDAMIAGEPGVQRRGATMPYVAVNGNMHAMISRADVIGIRLSDKDTATFLSTYNARPFESIPGLPNRDYVAIPRTMYKDIRTLQMWFKLSHGFAQKLPPKPTRT
jgi:hypothetical protein